MFLGIYINIDMVRRDGAPVDRDLYRHGLTGVRLSWVYDWIRGALLSLLGMALSAAQGTTQLGTQPRNSVLKSLLGFGLRVSQK